MDLFIKGAKLEGGRRDTPFLVNWVRLEALPVTPDLEQGLRAPIADPLFMLGRQWQMNEFRGEDAGTPIDVRLELERAALDRIRLGPPGAHPSDGAADFFESGPPLECIVEAEESPRRNLRLVAEAGLQLVRRLGAARLSAETAQLMQGYPLVVPATDPSTDRTGAAWARLLAGRAIDGVALAAALQPLVAADGALTGLPTLPGSPPAPATAQQLRTVLAAWLSEFDAAFHPGKPGRSAWLPLRQEYTFAARAKFNDGKSAALEAEEYTDGRLDWHTFSLKDDPGLDDPERPVVTAALVASPKLPSPVRYPGMPADRFYEFEDAATSFGRASGGRGDLLRMTLVEFALVYGNDWFYVPIDVPVGSLYSIRRLRVVDTFGVETQIDEPARGAEPRWSLYELTARGARSSRPWFFLPPVPPARLEGDPIEEVALFRDEMANMAWAVERKVASPVGGVIDRSLEPYSRSPRQELRDGTIEATIIYRLQTEVPDRWIPLVPNPRHPEGALGDAIVHELERRVLMRTLPDGTRVGVHPRGLILRTDPPLPPEKEAPLRLAEEEVPREGAVVRRTYQYARGADGSSYLWLGRAKTVGRGEGASDLEFDQLSRNE